ncbi:hypothetical protein ACLB1T_32435 [Escherichia coli]
MKMLMCRTAGAISKNILTYLQSGNLHSLRTWIKERGQDYHPRHSPHICLFPLRRRLQCQQPTLQALLAILDGVLINYIAICLASARKKQGKDALVVGWNIQDTTRLWLEGWIASQQGWRIDVLAHSLNQLRPELFEGRTLLVWCGENGTSAPNSSNSPVRGKNKAMIFSHSAFNDSLTNALYCTILSLT